MNTTTLALRAAGAATLFWILKAVAIGVAGGLGRSPLENPLYLCGLFSAVAAALLAGASYASGRSWAWKVLAAPLGLVVAAAFALAEGAVVAAVTPAHSGWAWFELNLWILALGLLVATGLKARQQAAGKAFSDRDGAEMERAFFRASV